MNNTRRKNFRIAAAVIGVAGLVAVGAAAAYMLPSGTTGQAAGHARPLACLSKNVRPAVADKTAFLALWRSCKPELAEILRPLDLPVTEVHQKAIFATLVAHRFARYGGSTALAWEAMLREQKMDCDNYAMLTWRLMRRYFGIDTGISMAGFHGGAIGNHAQMFFTAKGFTVLLDPTVGVVAFAGYNHVVAGKPVSPARVLTFSETKSVAWLRGRIRSALTGGAYLPSDVLYYVSQIGRYNRTVTSQQFLTPGGSKLRRDLARRKKPKTTPAVPAAPDGRPAQ